MSTKTKTSCPNCLKAFDVPAEYIGKRATCAGCKTKFVVAEAIPESPKDEYALQAELPPAAPTPLAFPAWDSIATASNNNAATKPPSLPPTKPPVSLPASPSKLKKFLDLKVLIPTLLALVLGYFAGREHLKYQIRSTMQQAFQGFAAGANKPLANVPSTNAPSNTPAPKAILGEPELPTLSVGQPFKKPGYTVTCTSANIAKVGLRSAIDKKTTIESDTDYLAIRLEFANTEERKQRMFRDPGSRFAAGPFRVKDDVGNAIRGIDFGFQVKVVGALESPHDIAPGESVSHIEVFALPLPKTQHIVLTVDLECIGGEGEVSYLIPMQVLTAKNQ